MTALPIIGMSPGNSYFKDDAVRFLLRETVARFGRAVVFVADVPAIQTYLALGYDEAKARRKAILKGNNLKNRTRNIMKELGFDGATVHVVEWDEEVADRPEYAEAYRSVLRLYDTNAAFAQAANETTGSVLWHAEPGRAADENAVRTAAQYLLSEFAFLECAPSLFGVEGVLYVYHKPWPVYERYIAGAFDGTAKPRLGFLQLAR